MKNTLLITTALVAVFSATNVYAETLPSDATNLTTGNYVVEDTGSQNVHNGNVKISEEALLNVSTYAEVDAENDIVSDYSHGFVIDGNLEVGDETNGGGSFSLKREDKEKPFMIVTGELAVNEGANLDMQSNDSFRASLNVGDNATIKGGDINLNQAEIFFNKDTNISGGTFNITDGGLYAEKTMGEGTAGNINISGGKINLLEKGEIETADGNISISNGEITLGNLSSVISNGNFTMSDGSLTASSNGNSADTGVFVKGASSVVNIQGGDINLTDSRIYKGNDTATSGDINLSGGNITLNKNAYIEMRKENTGNVNMTDGKLVLNENSGLLLNTDDDQNIDGNAIKLIVNGANASLTANGNNKITGDVDFTNGTITVANGATLTSGDVTMNSDNAKIDLSGKLAANVSGTGNIDFQNSAANISGNVDGAKLSFGANHSLSQAINGTISNLAALNVNNGTLNYDKDTGSIGKVVVASGAGLDIGTNNLTATDVTFADNSTLGLKIAAADNYGKVSATNINIGNDTTMKVTLDSGVVANGETKSFDFLQGTVTGDFTNKIANNNRYDINFDEGAFKITGTATASDVVADAGGSTNNAGTAEAWDSLTSSSYASSQAKAVASVLSDLSQTNEKAYVAALTAVAPEVAPMVQQNQSETANQVFGAVGTRLSGGSVSTGAQGMSSGDSVFKRGAMWVQGMFNKSKLDDTSKSKGFDADSNGIAFGAEKYLNDDVKAGIGYAYTNTDIDGFMRSTDVDTHTAIVYGEYKPSNWYVNGIATYGWSDYSEHKNVAGVGVKANYDAETFGVQAMTGYDMQVKGFGLTPEVGLRYVHISQDGYKDSADQKVSANDSDILTGVIGAKVNKSFELSNGMNIKPEARVAMTYDLMNDDANSVVTLANGSAYSVNGEALDRFGMEFGAGVTADVNDNVELSLGYEGKFREDYQDHTGLINAKYKF